jgi:hypothetical protein
MLGILNIAVSHLMAGLLLLLLAVLPMFGISPAQTLTLLGLLLDTLRIHQLPCVFLPILPNLSI